MGREVARAGLALACVVVWGLVMLLMAGCASARLEPVLTVLQRVDRQVGALALPAHAWTDLLARLRSRNGGGNG